MHEWIKQFPEVKHELDEIENAIEQYALAYAIAPDISVKQKVLNQITDINTEKTSVLNINDIKENKPGTFYSMPIYFKWAVAACVALLLGSIVMNYVFYNRYRSATSNLLSAQNQLIQQKQASDQALKQLNQQKKNIDFTQQQLEEQKQTANLTKEQLLHQKQTSDAVREELESQKQVAETMNKDLSVMTDKYSLPVVLKGTPHAPDALAKIFWMKNTGEVYVDPTYLPQAPAGKQYQLWAIVNEKPVSAGIILMSKKGVYRIQKMKSFGKAEAFAITLEKAGGSATPDMKEMYVMAKI